MMDRVLCSRAREVGGCRHVPRGARRTDPQTMESCSDFPLRWVYPGLFKYSLVFALRCWTMPYYGTVSYVYYVF